MIGNKIADKITISEKPAKELHNNDEIKEEEDEEIATAKKRYIYPEERKETIEESSLISKKYVWIKMHISGRKITNYW